MLVHIEVCSDMVALFVDKQLKKATSIMGDDARHVVTAVNSMIEYAKIIYGATSPEVKVVDTKPLKGVYTLVESRKDIPPTVALKQRKKK